MFESFIAKSLNIGEKQVSNTLKLLSEGSTIPFISRYRKEMTGSLDEVQIQNIEEQYDKLSTLQKRKEFILSSIGEEGKLTPELQKKIENSWSATELEDLYLPYKPKRKTRAEVARQKGLEPLAKRLMMQIDGKLSSVVSAYVKGEVKSAEDAIKGAQDIIAEWVSEQEGARDKVRRVFSREAVIVSRVVKGKEKEPDSAKFSDYFDFSEPLRKCSSHRLLAMRRGEAEGILRVSIAPEDDKNIEEGLFRIFVKGQSESSKLVEEAVLDGYKRLIKPAIETEFAGSSKQLADEEAIRVFAENLKQLLLAPPLGQKRVMAIDPGFRTGCKVVCLDAQGTLLHFEAIFPHAPQCKATEAASTLSRLVDKFQIEAISIGNGTAGRETEQLVQAISFSHPVQIFVVSENGASVYSASAIAREEFPKEDVTVRGAVSIGRRLMDPLAELVKIDPKSIGVGQYQHDVDQTKLKKSLDQTVINSVNMVGVNLNTASKHLLTYVSGLGPQLAQNIVDYRAENGPFKSRKELKRVSRLGEKAYEQCAGFLRIPDAANPLDNSAVHPERYAVVESMAAHLHCSVDDLIAHKQLRDSIDLAKYVTDSVGMPTLKDIKAELEKPGRDPRQHIETFSFDPTVHTIDDLHEGQLLPGIVTNITNFGAFVDVGVHQDGLVHVSQMSDHYVTNPLEVLSLHQHVEVKVLNVDHERSRIQLTMKDLQKK
jgi:protein Tex